MFAVLLQGYIIRLGFHCGPSDIMLKEKRNTRFMYILSKFRAERGTSANTVCYEIVITVIHDNPYYCATLFRVSNEKSALTISQNGYSGKKNTREVGGSDALNIA